MDNTIKGTLLYALALVLLLVGLNKSVQQNNPILTLLIIPVALILGTIGSLYIQVGMKVY